MKYLTTFMTVLCVLTFAGCTSRPPTIAHVHIGHALTGVHVTPPNQEGYLVTAERRGHEAVEFVQAAAASADLAEIKKNVAAAVHATDSEEDFGVKQAIVMAANHITFAATSDDASVNVQRAAPIFATDITRMVERCDLIVLLGKDVAASTAAQEATPSVAELGKLTTANMEGDDSNGDGVVGSAPSEYGLAQLLRKELQASGLHARIRQYQTVPQWYLLFSSGAPAQRHVGVRQTRTRRQHRWVQVGTHALRLACWDPQPSPGWAGPALADADSCASGDQLASPTPQPWKRSMMRAPLMELPARTISRA